MDEPDFWRAIRAEPENGFLWNAYADWFDDEGDGRGDLLRIANETANRHPAEAGYDDLWLAEERLIDAEGAAWLDRVPAWSNRIPAWIENLRFHRGFWLPIFTITTCKREARNFSEIPIWGLRLRTPRGTSNRTDLESLARKDELGLLRFLGFPPSVHVRGHGEFVTSPHLTDLHEANIDPLWLPTFYRAGADLFPKLRRLKIVEDNEDLRGTASENRIRPELLSRLDHLHANGRMLAPAIVETLGKARTPLALRSLRLASRRSDPEPWFSLFADPPFPDLTTLDLRGVSLRAAEFTALCTGPLRENLEALRLTIGLRPDDPLPSDLRFPKLRRLFLDDCRFASETWRALFRNRFLRERETLTIRFDRRTPPEWERIFATAGDFPFLTALHFEGVQLTAGEIGTLLTADRFPKLKRLTIATADAHAARVLLRSNLPNLRELTVHHRIFADESWGSGGERFPLLRNLLALIFYGSDSQMLRDVFASEPWKLTRFGVLSPQRVIAPNSPDLVDLLLESPLEDTLEWLRVESVYSGRHDEGAQLRRRFADALRAGDPPLSTAAPHLRADR